MIRPAAPEDLRDIMEIYRAARDFMMKTGNATQWGEDYPPQSLLEDDIAKKQLYVCSSDETIYGVFAFIIGNDPTYRIIEQGSWKNESLYGTIHRIASDGTTKGVLGECLDFCQTQIDHIRIDTHENNRVMQHLFEKHGFDRRGIIYTASGEPRIAYELFYENSAP